MAHDSVDYGEESHKNNGWNLIQSMLKIVNL